MTEGSKTINRRTMLAGAVGAAGAVLAVSEAQSKTANNKPNIVFIMADDLGYADVGVYGARHINTPNINALAHQGLQLFQGYSNSAVCSATRTGLITGRYQYRLRCGLEEPIVGLDVGLPDNLPTMPRQFHNLGYRSVLVGKWHLGSTPQYSPLLCGYDRFYGIQEGGADYFSHGLNTRGSSLKDGLNPIEQHGYMTDLLGDRAVQEINAAKHDKVPLFLSLHFTAPHWPWEGPEDEQLSKTISNPYDLEGGNLATYKTMVESLDANIGKVMRALNRNGMANNTIVIFTSDNGGERFSDTWPFIGAKTELLEGGIRVPIIMRWPRHIRAGSTSQQVMISMDFLPTLLAAAGGTPDPNFTPDGQNLLPVLLGQAPVHARTLFWRYKALEQAAVRDGDWKYLKIHGREYLFNLAQDERERANHKDQEPEKFARLKNMFDEWNAGMLPYTAATYTHSVRPDWSDR